MTSFYFYSYAWTLMSHFIHHKFIAPNFSGALSIQAKYPQILIRNQMERAISVQSGRNIWDNLWSWLALTSPLISVGPTRKSFPFDKIVVPSTALLYPACRGNNKQTRGSLERVCETGMNRSIGHVEFSKFQTKIFVEWKAPRHGGALRCLFQIADTRAF